MARYELANSAALDFETIFEFGIDTFGLAQALDYQNGMIKRFGELAEQPTLYAAVDHVRKGYAAVFTTHILFTTELNQGAFLLCEY